MHDDHKAFYNENGCLIVRGMFGSSKMAGLTSALASLRKKAESGAYRGNHLSENDKVARVICAPYDFCPTLRTLIDRHRRCLVIAINAFGNLAARPGWGAPVPPQLRE